MHQLQETIFLTLLMIFNFRLKYFDPKGKELNLKAILSDSIYVLLMCIGRLNSFYSRSGLGGLIYQTLWYLLQLAIDSFLLAAHFLNWWRQPFITSIFLRLVTTFALCVTQYFTPKARSKTGWDFMFLSLLHGILVSDVIRMSCFFATHQPLRQLIPLVLFLVFATLNIGLMACRKSGSRTPGMRICFCLLVSGLFLFCVWRLFMFRYEFSSEHFLTTKDHILALQILKAIDPYISVNEVVQKFPGGLKKVAMMLGGNGKNLSHLQSFLNIYSFVYPLEMEFETIRRYPNLSHKEVPSFDELSIFMIPPFSRYQKAKFVKKEFREIAMKTANKYYDWIMMEIQLIFLLGMLVNFYDAMKAFTMRFVIYPGMGLGKYCYSRAKDQVIKIKGQKAKSE